MRLTEDGAGEAQGAVGMCRYLDYDSKGAAKRGLYIPHVPWRVSGVASVLFLFFGGGHTSRSRLEKKTKEGRRSRYDDGWMNGKCRRA